MTSLTVGSRTPLLIQAIDGNFYGTTLLFQGHQVAYGTIFKVTPGGTFTVLNGLASVASLIQAGDGNFYGTAVSGLLSQSHTVFKMTPGGAVTVLHEFPGGGGDPALIQATDGNFYGINFNTVFKMTPGGTIGVLHTFTGGTDGAHPQASLIQASDGNFYGTTYSGGASGTGSCVSAQPFGAHRRFRRRREGGHHSFSPLRWDVVCAAIEHELHERNRRAVGQRLRYAREWRFRRRRQDGRCGLETLKRHLVHREFQLRYNSRLSMGKWKRCTCPGRLRWRRQG